MSAFRDASGNIEQYISFFFDLSQLRTAQSRAEYFAHHDPLTSLPNRAEVDRQLPGLLERAQQRGDSVTTALVDFGTGYSSLSYLQRFLVKKLKIDRSFVLALGRNQDRQGAVIASAIIGMAKDLDLKVIAEGV